MNNKLSIVFAILLSIAVGFAVYFWQQSEMTPQTPVEPETPAVETPIETPTDTEPIEDTSILDISEEEDQLVENQISEQGTFAYDEANYTYHGEFEALGYVVTKEIEEGFCAENCKTFNYAFFNILETKNQPIADYIAESAGNSFVGDMSVAIGCFTDNNLLWRMNHSDELGMQKYQNSDSSSETLLNSSPTNLIKVKLERALFTGGSGAPDCYSHFGKVNIIE